MLSQLNINVVNNTPTSAPRNINIVKQSQKSVGRTIDFGADDGEENDLALRNKKMEGEKKQNNLKTETAEKNGKIINENKLKQTKEKKATSTYVNPDPDMRFTYLGNVKPDLYEDTFIRLLEKESFEKLEDDWPNNSDSKANDNFDIFEQLDDEYENGYSNLVI
uniref:Uncharacterized protein n=1 Tax=Meloidogyne enterolobii TaxID=390850 RepID=A0A6V7V1V3_MELEN|nr:unnamed protein product [Meloidogyne enterolobii]